MMVPKDDERRQHARVAFATDIRIHLEADGRTVHLKGSSKDLSLKGIFVQTEDRFELDTACEIKIYLTGSIDEIALDVTGRVARVSQNGMGIVFDSMDVDSYSHLKNIVQYNSIDNQPE